MSLLQMIIFFCLRPGYISLSSGHFVIVQECVPQALSIIRASVARVAINGVSDLHV